jgi:hypothetical protein
MTPKEVLFAVSPVGDGHYQLYRDGFPLGRPMTKGEMLLWLDGYKEGMRFVARVTDEYISPVIEMPEKKEGHTLH